MNGTCEIVSRNGFSRLEKQIRRLNAQMIRIGPADTTREDGLSNSQIGAIHENDSKGWGFRSFLKFPIQYRLRELLEHFVWQPESLWDDPEGLSKDIAKVALQAIDEAFETSGWGWWAKLAPDTIQEKLAHGSPTPDGILMDTGKLRKSITSEIVI